MNSVYLPEPGIAYIEETMEEIEREHEVETLLETLNAEGHIFDNGGQELPMWLFYAWAWDRPEAEQVDGDDWHEEEQNLKRKWIEEVLNGDYES